LRAARSEAQKLRGIASLAADLADLQDSVAKLSGLAKRINSREVMRERREAPADSLQSAGHMTLKDQLRLQAGLTAGRPAQHK
jgi:hypothetical protein